MSEKFTPQYEENIVENETHDNDRDVDVVEGFDFAQEQGVDTQEDKSDKIESLSHEARDLADDSEIESNQSDNRERFHHTIAEIMNRVGDGGMKQLELLAHSSERLNGLRGAIESGMIFSPEVIQDETVAVKQMVLETQRINRQGYELSDSTKELLNDTEQSYESDQRDDHIQKLDSVRNAIENEVDTHDKEVISALESIPTKGNVSKIVSAMEEVISILRSRGSEFSHSSTAQLLSVLQEIDSSS